MPPHRQLKTANVLISFGLLPWTLNIGWVAAVFLSRGPDHRPGVFMLDPISMIVILLATFAFAVVVAGASVLWSWSLTARHRELRSGRAAWFRLAVALALSVPIVCSIFAIS
jgi:hypothetical protein